MPHLLIVKWLVQFLMNVHRCYFWGESAQNSFLVNRNFSEMGTQWLLRVSTQGHFKIFIMQCLRQLVDSAVPSFFCISYHGCEKYFD